MKFDDIIKQVEENVYSAFFYTPAIYKKAMSYLFLKPAEIITVNKMEDLKLAFKEAQRLIDKKQYGYSILKYEAGFLFEKKLHALISDSDQNLFQFFFFNKHEARELKSSKIIFDDTLGPDYSISNFKLNRNESEFQKDIEKIKNYIKEGETYQVNYTVNGKFNFSGSYSSFFKKLLFNQSARYSAFINNRENFIISLSPELFFHKKGKSIYSKPMKGTIRRGYNIHSDQSAKSELQTSEKNLAENVMIVDLIRNDLGRICRYGSIEVPKLFQVEKYESLFQMVSEVRGKLRRKVNVSDIFQNTFPCGSVTGAPKIRTMEIIDEIEKEKRGIYTGSVGLITPKELKMNVAIRTITLDKKSGNGIMGLGSGIVWDSNPQSEYDEVILKSKFLTEPMNYFEIFETMRYENNKILFLEDHIERMKSAADYFLFKFSKNKIRKLIETEILKHKEKHPQKIKMCLNKYGRLNLNFSEIPIQPEIISVVISKNKISSTDKFRHFKTTNRKLYDDEYSKFNSEGFYEVIYFNEKDELVEGSRTNIFITKGESFFTPALESGVLPGICRKYFISKNNVIEKNINREELINADEIILTNALKGEMKVNRLFISSDEYVEFKMTELV